MCGAYALHHNKVDIAARFEAIGDAASAPPRYKISPSESIDVVRVRAGGERAIESLQWGLIPSWAKEAAIDGKMINARAETVAVKPAFRSAFRSRRCLIPADGFFEWDRVSKSPMYFRRRDEQLFAFAGLWESWENGVDGEERETCAVITTAANGVVGQIHARMPVMLEREGEAMWLDKSARTDDLLELLKPFSDDRMEGYAVGRSVNGRGVHGPETIAPRLAAATYSLGL